MEHKTQQELLRLFYEKKMPRNEILDYIISEGYFEQNNALHQYLIMTQNGAQINHDISDPRINVSLHSHEFYEIIYVRQVDNLEYLWENNRYRINSGDIILIPPGVSHRPIFPEKPSIPYDRYALWIDTAFFDAQCKMFPELGYAINVCKEKNTGLFRSNSAISSLLQAEFTNLSSAQLDRKYGWEASVSLGAINLMLMISKAVYNNTATASQLTERGLIDDMFHYIDDNIAHRLTLDDIAEHFHVSKSTVSHLFQKQLQVSFYQCVIQRRLLLSKQKLSEGVNPTIVCVECGFADYPSFYRHFRKEYGCSPKEFQRFRAM